jgi:hypothetical protein
LGNNKNATTGSALQKLSEELNRAAAIVGTVEKSATAWEQQVGSESQDEG